MTQHTLPVPTSAGDLERESILNAPVGSLSFLPNQDVRPNFQDTCHFKNDNAPRVDLELPEAPSIGRVLPVL